MSDTTLPVTPSPAGLGTQLSLREGDALLIVDVQCDFLHGGDSGLAPSILAVLAFDAIVLAIMYFVSAMPMAMI